MLQNAWLSTEVITPGQKAEQFVGVLESLGWHGKEICELSWLSCELVPGHG